jgi:anti-sigma factor RsiW
MNCAKLETLLCDFVDGTIPPAERRLVEAHLEECSECAEMAQAAAAITVLTERAERIEPPPHLMTRILYELGEARDKALQKRPGPLAALRRWMGPVLQPRFAMGMAMTILSLAMLARAVRLDVRQLAISDLDPVRIWQDVDNRAHRTLTRAVKFYENLRFVYEIRSRLSELAAEDEGASQESARPGESGQKGELRRQGIRSDKGE